MTQRRHGGAQWLAWLREQPESGLSVSAALRRASTLPELHWRSIRTFTDNATHAYHWA